MPGVRGSGRSEQGNEDHHTNGHGDAHLVDARVIVSKGQDDRQKDHGHAGVIGKIGDEQSKAHDEEEEKDLGAAA